MQEQEHAGCWQIHPGNHKIDSRQTKPAGAHGAERYQQGLHEALWYRMMYRRVHAVHAQPQGLCIRPPQLSADSSPEPSTAADATVAAQHDGGRAGVERITAWWVRAGRAPRQEYVTMVIQACMHACAGCQARMQLPIRKGGTGEARLGREGESDGHAARSERARARAARSIDAGSCPLGAHRPPPPSLPSSSPSCA